MGELEKLLESAAKEIAEMVGASVVNMETGLALASYSVDPSFDVSVSSAAYAEVLKQNDVALDLLGGPEVVGEVEDILVTTDKFYFLVRKLGNKHFLGVAITKKGNLGLARVIMKKYEPKMEEELAELDEM
ncbi:roadblock/LC7 domain-containing protein [Thermotomaculum hydrothermale]|nr:hypothetical protein [Thermotomaculum hydrothermale]